jgi:thiamine biosynthesis lipoprotein
MAVVELRFRVMASEAHVVLVDAPEHLGSEARRQLERLEGIWSRFLPTSDVMRLNDRAGRAVPVDPDTVTLVVTMAEAWRRTDHRYDPTLLPALVASGYGASIDDPTRVTVLAEHARPGGDLDAVDIDAVASTVTLPPRMAIDPGGIGKGLAADLVVARLLAAGAAGALVAIGGDLAMAGRASSPRGWQVAVERPDPDESILGTLAVSGGGVATSSTRSRRWRHDGEVRHHVIDPVTAGVSGTDLAAVTVVAATGWLAEAHATAALLVGADGVLDHLDRHGLVGLAVAADGHVLASPGLSGLATPAGVR